jgi:hypothetical protein
MKKYIISGAYMADSRPLLNVGERMEHDGSILAVADFSRINGVAQKLIFA